MKPGEINKLALRQTLETIFGSERVELEYRFHPVRRWRFDYAVPEIRLAVEYHGHAGFVGKGASGHSTIKGLTNDCEKINSAIAAGWRVLAFTALHFKFTDRSKHNLTDVRTTILDALAAMQQEIEEGTTPEPSAAPNRF
jgi:hypothetical protein